MRCWHSIGGQQLHLKRQLEPVGLLEAVEGS